jgi:hypothetical protein
MTAQPAVSLELLIDQACTGDSGVDVILSHEDDVIYLSLPENFAQ